jgi:hypothetical protein
MPKIDHEIELSLNVNTLLRARGVRGPSDSGRRGPDAGHVEFALVSIDAEKEETRYVIDTADAHAIASMMRAGAK